jgi:hypothetical protein
VIFGLDESYEGVVTIDAGSHPLAIEQGAHSAVVRVFRGVTSHVIALEVCLDDSFCFDVQRSLTVPRARPLLRGSVMIGEHRVRVGARAVHPAERSFDLFAGNGRDLARVGSLRLGQRIVVEGESAARDGWGFALMKAAA